MHIRKDNKLRIILDYLRGSVSKDGEHLTDTWVNDLTNDTSKIDSFDKSELEELQGRLKEKIDSRIENHNRRSITLPEQNSWSGRKIFSGPVIRIAATVIIIIGFSFSIGYLLLKDRNHAEYVQQSHFIEKYIPNGEKSQLTLSDGTKIHLNSGSRIRYPASFTGETRDVYLEGEAFFEVTKNEEKPFIVHSEGINTTVLGTAFNVRSNTNEKNIRISLISGKVRVDFPESTMDENNHEIYLTPGEMITFNRLDNSFEKQTGLVTNDIGWKDNILVLDDISFLEAALMIERWYNIPVILRNKELEDKYFMGKHIDPELEQVLESLSFVTGAKCEVIRDTLFIE